METRENTLETDSYWAACWGPCWWIRPALERNLGGGHRRNLLNRGGRWRGPSPSNLKQVSLSSLGESSRSSSPPESKAIPGIPLWFSLQSQSRSNKETLWGDRVREKQQQRPWAVQGGGFSLTGAKVSRQRQQQQQQQQRGSRVYGRERRGEKNEVAGTVAPVTAASVAPYPTTDVPWVVAAPAYRQLCSLKGKASSTLQAFPLWFDV